MTFVLGVSRFSISSTRMFRVAASMSARTGRRPAVHDRVERGDEGQRRRDDLVARPDAERQERDVQPRRGGRDRHREAAADIVRERRGELLDLGPRRDPPRAQRVHDLRDFLLAEPRPGKREKGIPHWPQV